MLQRILLYMSGKRHTILQKKILYTETIELIELGRASVLSYVTADFIDRNIL